MAQSTNDPNHTAPIIRQGRALVKAIEGISEIDATGHIEQFVTRLLVASRKERLLPPLPG
jgi:hypothetical protein